MNIVFISHALKDPEAWRSALGIDKVIHIEQPDKFLGLRDASIALDELIYIDRQQVDFVLYCCNESGIVKWPEFQQINSHIEKTSDTVYFTQDGPTDIINLSGNFYCRPHVFTIMGSLYKLELDQYPELGQAISNKTDTRIIYGLIKGGYKVSLL